MEDFVTFELAKKLKEKGFNWKVNAYYGKHENIFDVHPAMDMNDCEYRCSAPTIPQVLKWLREEKKLNVNMRLYIEDKWYYTIQNNKGDFIYSHLVGSDVLYESYEEATITGIKYAIANLI